MHHKKKKPKNARAGCLMCKPHKMNGYGHTKSFHGPNKVGCSNLKKAFFAKEDCKHYED
jgi:hypothetical protein